MTSAAIRDAFAPRAGTEAEESALRAFRLYFAAYSVLDCIIGTFTQQVLLLRGSYQPDLGWKQLLLNAAVVLAAVVFTRKKNYQWGAILLAGYHFLEVTKSFPSSGNHRYLEMLIYLSFAIVDPREMGRLLRYAIITIFFYSGIQKALYGFYWSGEIFALDAYASPPHATWVFRSQLELIAKTFGLELPQLPAAFDWSRNAAIALPAWLATTFKIYGRGALAAEIFLPLLVLHRRVREGALASLILFSVFIAVFSSEYEFASTNLACLALFYPRHARWVLPLVFVGLRFLTATTKVFAS